MSLRPAAWAPDEPVMVWGLHCDEDLDLVGGAVAAMGWDDLGNLNQAKPTREAFREAVSETCEHLRVPAAHRAQLGTIGSRHARL